MSRSENLYNRLFEVVKDAIKDGPEEVSPEEVAEILIDLESACRSRALDVLKESGPCQYVQAKQWIMVAEMFGHV